MLVYVILSVLIPQYSPIFWKKSLLRLLDWDYFWLSSTPFEVGSKYPGAGSVRICTVAHFQLASGELTVLVTHWGSSYSVQV